MEECLDIIFLMSDSTLGVAVLPAAPDAQERLFRPTGGRPLPHVRALDGIRGLAAVAIVMHHALLTLPDAVWPLYVHWTQLITSYFYLGVDLFFVLSGYLITSLLLLARRSPNFYRNFYWKRVFRILPALVLVLLVTHYAGWLSWHEVFLALFFVANLRELWHMPEGGPFWSLAIEEQFYIVWPAVVRHERPRAMYRTLLALMILPVLLRAISVALHHGRMHYTFIHCDGLAWGALLAMLAYRARIPFRDYNNARFWMGTGRWMLLFGIPTMVVGLGLEIAHRPEYGLILTASPPLFSGVLAYLITHRQGLWSRFFSSVPMRFLGSISYMMYLSHAYIMATYDKVFHGFWSHPTPTGYYVRFVAVMVSTILICAASLHLFEQPIGRLRSKFLR